jgi:uncharacterized protein YcfL
MQNGISMRVMVFPALFLGAALVMGTSGCGTSGIAGSVNVRPNGVQESRVKIDNQFLSSNLKFTGLVATFSGDMLVAHAEVTSKHNSALDVQYKFRWYDASGLEVAPDGAPWQPLKLFGGESKGLQAVAPNPSVKEFKIEIRYTK